LPDARSVGGEHDASAARISVRVLDHGRNDVDAEREHRDVEDDEIPTGD
jgi:hypothetical protein